jgi:N-acetylglucosaminyl-diphospho-decaprenol L-rhamnosyltransferase
MNPECEVTVLIVSYNTCDDLHRCLDALRNTGAPESAIAVADNGSTDGTIAMMRMKFPGVQCIENRRNRMYAEATNQLIEATQSQYVVLLNPDTQPDYASLCTLTSHFECTPDLAAVAPQLRHIHDGIQWSCRRLPTAYTPWAEAWSALTGRPSRWKMTSFSHDEKSFVLQPMFSAIVIARSVWWAVGGLHADYPLFFNDVDWCYRAHRAGLKILFDPSVRVVHACGGTTSKYPWRKLWHSHMSFARFIWRTRTDTLVALWGVMGVWLSLGVRSVTGLFQHQ